MDWNSARASQDSDIPTDLLHSILNNCLDNAIFPSILKTAYVVPVFSLHWLFVP